MPVVRRDHGVTRRGNFLRSAIACHFFVPCGHLRLPHILRLTRVRALNTNSPSFLLSPLFSFAVDDVFLSKTVDGLTEGLDTFFLLFAVSMIAVESSVGCGCGWFIDGCVLLSVLATKRWFRILCRTTSEHFPPCHSHDYTQLLHTLF